MITETPRRHRLDRALLALDGLSLGDAFGEHFFRAELELGQQLERRELPTAEIWHYPQPTWSTPETMSLNPVIKASASALPGGSEPCPPRLEVITPV